MSIATRLRVLACIGAVLVLPDAVASVARAQTPPSAEQVRLQLRFRDLFNQADYARAMDAAAAFERSLQGSANYESWYILGTDYNVLREWERAIPAFNRSIQLAPGHGEAFTNRGVAYEGLGQFQMAMADYRRGASLGNALGARNARDLTEKIAAAAAQPAGPDLGQRVQTLNNLRYSRQKYCAANPHEC